MYWYVWWFIVFFLLKWYIDDDSSSKQEVESSTELNVPGNEMLEVKLAQFPDPIYLLKHGDDDEWFYISSSRGRPVLMHGLRWQALEKKRQMILETDEVVFVYTVASRGIISMFWLS